MVFYSSFRIIFVLLSFLFYVNGISYDSGNEDERGSALSTLHVIVISAGCLSGLVLCSFCTWTWWKRILFGRSTNTADIQDAVYEDGIGYSYRDNRGQILDPRNLNDSRVQIEPLPTLNDLGQVVPTHSRTSSFELQGFRVPTIASSDFGGESDIHAEDWFEDSFRHNFPRTKVEYIKEIGRGWFGKVIEAQVADLIPQFKSSKAVVLVQKEECTDRDQMKYLNDARFYRDVDHDNILKLLGYCIERAPYMLIFPNWPLGDLKYFLITNADRGEAMYKQGTLHRMAKDIATALEHMGSIGYVHGDLAARNCLVGNTAGKIIIGDYGLAPQAYREDYYWNGQTGWPIRWAAPETMHCVLDTIQGKQITTMSNVWTFAILLWEIFECGKAPYPELSNEAVLDQVIIAKTYILEPPRTSFLTMKTKDSLYNIMLSCWNIDPENRPTITNVLETLASSTPLEE